jgi:iron complex transport system permease protein
MFNSVLLFGAGVATAAALWLMLRGNRAVGPAATMALIMFVAALGGPVWEWAKDAGGAGLPPRVIAPAFDGSLAVQAFCWASIGAAAGALCVPRLPGPAGRTNVVWHPSQRAKFTLLGISVGGFIAWIVGFGPAFFDREFYGQFNGNDFLLRAAFPLAMIVGVLLLGISTSEQNRAVRLAIYASSIAWFVGLAGTGSRTALVFPLVGAVLMIRHSIVARRLSILPLAGAGCLLVLAVFSFAVVLQARSMQHGLLNMPTVISTVVENARSSTDSYLLPVKQLLASIFASVPIAEQSARYEVGLDVLLGNANILPGTAQPMELERYWPYEWVPLSFAGCWFGVTGWLGQVGLFGFMSWVCSYAVYNFHRGRYSFLAFLPLMLSAMISVLSLQYSSRMVWRVFSVVLILCLIGYLTRDRVRSPRIDVPAMASS